MASGLLLLVFFLMWASVCPGAVPREYEPDYAEAVLAYHDGKFTEVLRFLTPMLTKGTKSEEILEIAALTYQSMGQQPRAEKTYKQIVDMLVNRKENEAKIIPYQFELAMIYFRTKRWKEAKGFFARAIALNFNEVPSRFFLGIIAMSEKDWDTAETSFFQVSQTPMMELALSSHLYLAEIYASQNFQRRMVNEYVMAYSQARDELRRKDLSDEDRAMVNKVLKIADKALKPLKKSSFFANVGLITAYDTNVFSDAATVAASGGTLKGSLKETLQIGFGYSSPLLDEWQYVVGYRGNGNKNFNSETADAQFIQNELNINVNHTPLENSSLGMRLGALYLFQYVGTSSRYEPYLLQGLGGPNFRMQFSKGWSVSSQGTFYYRNQYTDSATSEDNQRSGNEFEVKVAAGKDTQSFFANPSAELTVALRPTKGSEFQAKFAQLELLNNSYLTPGIQLLTSLTVGKTIYSNRPDGQRDDLTLTGRLSLGVRLLQRLQLLADLQYINNASNVDLYAYSRGVFSAGLTYGF